MVDGKFWRRSPWATSSDHHHRRHHDRYALGRSDTKPTTRAYLPAPPTAASINATNSRYPAVGHGTRLSGELPFAGVHWLRHPLLGRRARAADQIDLNVDPRNFPPSRKRVCRTRNSPARPIPSGRKASRGYGVPVLTGLLRRSPSPAGRGLG